MNKIVKGVLAGFLSFVVIYAFGSFMAWDLNPGGWSDYGRMMAGFFGIFAFAIVFLLASGVIDQ